MSVPPPPPAGSWEPSAWAPPPLAAPQPAPQAAPPARPSPLKPLDIGEVLDGMFKTFTRNPRTCLLALGAVLVPTQLISTFLQRGLFDRPGLFELLNNPETAGTTGDPAAMLGAVGMALVAAGATSVFVQPFLYGIGVVIATAGYYGLPIGPGEALRRAGRRYWALVGSGLIVSTVLLLAVLPGVAAAVGAAATESVGLAVGAVVLVIVGMLVAAFGLVLLVLIPPVVILEGLGPIDAAKRSARLVRRRYGGVLGAGLLAYLISGTVGFVVAAPFTISAQAVSGTAAAVWTALAALVSGVLTTPLLAGAITLLYYDVRVRTEALDLQVYAGGLDPR